MKKFTASITALTVAFTIMVSTQAVFAHHDAPEIREHHYGFDYIPQKGGYTGDTDITSVLEAKKLGGSVYVRLKGKIASKLGKETYLFKDNTGTVKIEIDDDDWNGVKAGPKDTVIIEGEMEREQGGVFVEVEKIELAN